MASPSYHDDPLARCVAQLQELRSSLSRLGFVEPSQFIVASERVIEYMEDVHLADKFGANEWTYTWWAWGDVSELQSKALHAFKKSIIVNVLDSKYGEMLRHDIEKWNQTIRGFVRHLIDILRGEVDVTRARFHMIHKGEKLLEILDGIQQEMDSAGRQEAEQLSVIAQILYSVKEAASTIEDSASSIKPDGAAPTSASIESTQAQSESVISNFCIEQMKLDLGEAVTRYESLTGRALDSKTLTRILPPPSACHLRPYLDSLISKIDARFSAEEFDTTGKDSFEVSEGLGRSISATARTLTGESDP